jgi:mannosylglycerate hydrolase MGH1-like protein
MAMFCLDMLTIAVELALDNPIYEDLACKFFEHFVYIAGAMDHIGIHNDELWEEDGFYYDVLRLPHGEAMRVKVRSMVGLIPLFASAIFSSDILEQLPRFKKRVARFVELNAHLMTQISNPSELGVADRILLSPVNRHKLTRILQRMLDTSEFLSPYGIRALSRYHKGHPYIFTVEGHVHRVDYEPAESSTGLFGGNSNWRGPIWLPVNLLLIQSLGKMYSYYGDEFTIECPTGSGHHMNLWEVANEIVRRLGDIFLRDAQGRRPVHRQAKKFQTDPYWRDLILFYEYFHGDNGAGIGASHQTGWTGLVAGLLMSLEVLDPKEILDKGFDAVALKLTQ